MDICPNTAHTVKKGRNGERKKEVLSEIVQYDLSIAHVCSRLDWRESRVSVADLGSSEESETCSAWSNLPRDHHSLLVHFLSSHGNLLL